METAAAAGASLTTVQIVEEIAAARLEGGMVQAIEPEEEGYEAEEPPEPEEQERPGRKKRRLERPRTPPRH
eukprot:3951013-Alexandrium_andersonii.AAC.1